MNSPFMILLGGDGSNLQDIFSKLGGGAGNPFAQLGSNLQQSGLFSGLGQLGNLYGGAGASDGSLASLGTQFAQNQPAAGGGSSALVQPTAPTPPSTIDPNSPGEASKNLIGAGLGLSSSGAMTGSNNWLDLLRQGGYGSKGFLGGYGS